MALIKRGTERNRTNEDTGELVRKRAVHTSDQQIAAILNKQARRTGTGLPFNQPRIRSNAANCTPSRSSADDEEA